MGIRVPPFNVSKHTPNPGFAAVHRAVCGASSRARVGSGEACSMSFEELVNVRQCRSIRDVCLISSDRIGRERLDVQLLQTLRQLSSPFLRRDRLLQLGISEKSCRLFRNSRWSPVGQSSAATGSRSTLDPPCDLLQTLKGARERHGSLLSRERITNSRLRSWLRRMVSSRSSLASGISLRSQSRVTHCSLPDSSQ